MNYFLFWIINQHLIFSKRIFKIEYSIENLWCYRDIQKFNENPIETLSQEIYENYLNQSSSPFEINISRNFYEEIQQKIENGLGKDETLFKELEMNIIVNLTDSFSRFQETLSYKQLKFKLITQNNLLEVDLAQYKRNIKNKIKNEKQESNLFSN